MAYLSNEKYEVIWLNSFKDELSHIYDYLTNELNQNYIAKRFHKKVLNSLNLLSYYPEIHQKIYHNKNIRRIIIGKYAILYAVDKDKKKVFLLHIFHGNQDYLNKL